MNKRWMTAASTFGAATMVFGAAALAQTPSPGTTTTPSASVTAGGTGTAVRTGTAQTTGTAQVTGTVGVIATIPVPSSVYVAGGTGQFPFAHPAFDRTFRRTDQLVNEGKVKRTYFWGPGPNTPGLLEQYNQAPGGGRQRLVQYFDKSRMEINNPQGDQNNAFFVTNGLLTVELISGRIQVGDEDFTNYRAACIPMSGDFGDTMAPTYFAFQKVSSTQGENPSTDRRGQKVSQTIDRNGTVGNDPSKANNAGTELTAFFPETKHNVPKVFFDFLNQTGPIINNQGQTVEGRLIDPLVFVTGFPISEPYWTKATIQGKLTDVMIQAYQRRALTYVPTNPTGFQVEMANIGQHYFDWRYRNAGFCPGQPVTTPTPPIPAPTGTVGTGTGTPAVTGTVVPGTGTVVPRTPAVTGTVSPGATSVTTTPNPSFTVPAITTTPNPTFTGSPSGSPTGVPQPIPVTPTP